MKELAKRVSVAVWGIPAVLGLSYLGGAWFLLLVILITGVSLWEFYTMFRHREIYAYRSSGAVLGVLMIIAAYGLGLTGTVPLMLLSVLFLSLLNLKPQRGLVSQNFALSVAGIFYIALFLAAMVMVRNDFQTVFDDASLRVKNPGGIFLIIVWCAIWICDTAAYFGGKRFGNHKLAPTISPGKTVEGALFGLVSGIAVFMLLGNGLLPGVPGIFHLAAGVVIGVFGQLGDLVESRFKRDAGVKDTSAILPGHGGFLDRFDSFIFVSPFLYLLTLIFNS